MFYSSVAKHVKLFLLQIDEDPLFHIDEVNPTLYNVIKEINKAKVMYFTTIIRCVYID